MKKMLRWLASLLTLVLLSTSVNAVDVKTFIPEKAKKVIPFLIDEQKRYLPDFPEPAYFGALGEHESCISLTKRHERRCYDPTSQLKTQREEGAGIPQITRAYNKDGSLRFDTLQEIRSRYRTELRELTWSNVYTRPDLQVRFMVLLTKDNWTALHVVKDPVNRMYFTDSAYNGGLGAVKKDIQLCGLMRGCDPGRWFGHVEKYSYKSRKAIYGNRSAYDINRHHVSDVFHLRLPKYKAYYKALYEPTTPPRQQVVVSQPEPPVVVVEKPQEPVTKVAVVVTPPSPKLKSEEAISKPTPKAKVVKVMKKPTSTIKKKPTPKPVKVKKVVKPTSNWILDADGTWIVK